MKRMWAKEQLGGGLPKYVQATFSSYTNFEKFLEEFFGTADSVNTQKTYDLGLLKITNAAYFSFKGLLSGGTISGYLQNLVFHITIKSSGTVYWNNTEYNGAFVLELEAPNASYQVGKVSTTLRYFNGTDIAVLDQSTYSVKRPPQELQLIGPISEGLHGMAL